MLSYCLKCRKNTESKNVRAKNGRIMFLPKCGVCGWNLKLIKEQKAYELLSSLGRKTSLSKNPLLGPLLV